MPLHPGSSEAVIGRNIAEMRRAGHPESQAAAAALHNADRRPRAGGGGMPNMGAIDAALMLAQQPVHRSSRPIKPPTHAAPAKVTSPKSKDTPGIPFRGGLIDAPVHGRTDRIPLDVPSGSYVLPADIVSALGQGNTAAGAAVIQEVMKDAPYHAGAGAYGSSIPPMAHGSGPPGPHPGGPPTPPANQESLGDVAGPEPPHMADGGEDRVAPIIAAGGEYVISPQEVRWIGDGSIEKGHRLLDAFVNETRKKHIQTLKKLPGPKK